MCHILSSWFFQQAMIAVSGMHELVVKEIQNHNPEILAVESDKFSKWQSNSKLFLPGIEKENWKKKEKYRSL